MNYKPLLQILFASVFLFALTSICEAVQTRPLDGDYILQDEMVFRQNEVTICHITVNPNELQDMYNDPENNTKRNVTVRWQNSVLDQTLENVGMRPRGNFSRTAQRKSWKLDFNEFVPGRSFFGLEEMDLNGDNNDPTLMRRMMAHELMRRMGLPVSRTHYVAIYMNDEFWSLNVHVEAIDEQFVEHWFGNKNGNLYKCLYGGERADLAYRSQNDYQTYGGGETYRETNNDPNSDYTDLSEFIDFLNNSSNSTVYDELPSHFNTDNIFRYLASNVALGSWDDYWYGSNNYYLYWNEETLSFEIIPFDYDNSLNIDYFGVDWSTRNYPNWGDGGFGSSPAPLVDELFRHSHWRRQYRRYLAETTEILSDPEYQSLLTQYHALMLPWFDGTIESGGEVGTITSANQHNPHFEQYNLPENFTTSQDAHRQGLLPFFQDRASSLNQQLSQLNTPELPNVFVNEVVSANVSIGSDNFGEFDDWIELYNAESSPVDLSGWHLTDNPSDPTRYQFPNGTMIPANGYLQIFADAELDQQTPTALHASFKLGGSGETVALYSTVENGTVLIDYLPATLLTTNQSVGRLPDGSANLEVFPCPTPLTANNSNTDCNIIEPRTPPQLFINEFMADNDTIISDNFGEFDDWFEIYNAETSYVNLGGLHLSDDPAKPTKWEIPNGLGIEAKGFLLVWADNDLEQNSATELHAAFNLSKNGESIGIYDNDENLNQLIHNLTFGLEETNVSSGLLPDGSEDPFEVLEEPTPGATNDLTPQVPFDHWIYQ